MAQRKTEAASGLPQIEPVDNRIFDVDIHAIPAIKAESAHFHCDVRFAFRAVDSDDFTVSDESNALAWIPIADMPQHVSEESICRMARKWLHQHA